MPEAHPKMIHIVLRTGPLARSARSSGIRLSVGSGAAFLYCSCFLSERLPCAASQQKRSSTVCEIPHLRVDRNGVDRQRPPGICSDLPPEINQAAQQAASTNTFVTSWTRT